MNNVMQSYKQTQFNTLGRADITLMLYDGAIRFLEQAHEKILQKDMQAKGNLISRTIDIINELDASLNIQQGGDLAKRLHELYFLSTKNLLMANLKVDVGILKSVKTNLETLRDAFAQAMETPEAKSMLQRMGPLPQNTTSSANNRHVGGDIHQRAEQIKAAKEKVENIQKAQAKLDNATTQEEKLRAQNEINILLQQAKPAAMSKAVPASLAQKAALAFKKTNAQLSPVSQVEAIPQNITAAVKNNIETSGGVSPVPLNALQKATLYASTQARNIQSVSTNVQAQNKQNAQSTQIEQTTRTNSTVNQLTSVHANSSPLAPQSSQTENLQEVQSPQAPQAQATVPQAPQAQATVPQAPQAQATVPPVPQAQSMSGLMNRKMALYKNIHNR